MKLAGVMALFLVPALIGCVAVKQSPPPAIDYYTLEYEPPKLSRPHPLRAVIRVERFQVSPYYSSPNIMFQDKTFRKEAYHYQKWRANPADMVTYFLARDLRESGLFSGVFVLSSKFPASHVIDGTLDEFYQDARGDFWEAVVSFNITLMKEYEPDISRRVLYQKRYHIRKRCELKNPRSLAEAMSLAMLELSKQAGSDVYRSISENP